jgi:hypothetical protein
LKLLSGGTTQHERRDAERYDRREISRRMLAQVRMKGRRYRVRGGVVSDVAGTFLPAKTPRGIVDKLHRETLKALQEPKVRDKLAKLGVDPMVMTPAEFDALVEKEVAINAALVKAAGIKTH